MSLPFLQVKTEISDKFNFIHSCWQTLKKKITGKWWITPAVGSPYMHLQGESGTLELPNGRGFKVRVIMILQRLDGALVDSLNEDHLGRQTLGSVITAVILLFLE